MSISGKTVLITGGGTGIGAACAIALAKEGCVVAISGRRPEKLEEVVRQAPRGTTIKARQCDVGDRDDVNELFAWADRELGRVDILIQSAGVNVKNRAMDELTPDDWDRLLRINATGVYNCMYAVLPQMRERRDGLIINISSIAGIRAGLLGGVGYNASKFAMAALGLTVAQEVKDLGIRVTTIYPGEVDTPILEHRPVPVDAAHRARILQPEDVAEAVLMIARLPARANVSEMTIKPTTQAFC